MEQVTENVYEVGGMGVNTFILKSEDGLAVVDAGMPGHHRRIIPAVRELGHPPHAITDILITHADIDHIGGLAKLAATTGATVHAGRKAADLMQRNKAPSHGSPVMAIFMGPTQKLMVRPFTVDHTYADGDDIPFGGGLQVIETPGHTPDHVSFYWPAEGVLFAGDLLNRFQTEIALSPPIMSWNMEATRSSAKKALATQPNTICVGHGSWLDASTQAEQVAALSR